MNHYSNKFDKSLETKLKTFFEKYFGIGGSSTFTEPEHNTVKYSLDEQNTLSMVAESKIPYGNE